LNIEHNPADGMELALMLLRVRERARMTQADVAEEMGVTQSAVAKIEQRHNSSMTVDIISRYMKACGRKFRMSI
jgi:transcriptional regulator with XRE-family HTH domain